MLPCVTDVLHSIRSLLCTATNSTPHDRIFTYSRKSTCGTSLPEWLSTPGSTVLLRRHDRTSKYDSPVEKVEVLNCNPQYAEVRFSSGRESTVSLRDLAPFTVDTIENQPNPPNDKSLRDSISIPDSITPVNNVIPIASPEIRRSGRHIEPIDRLGII